MSKKKTIREVRAEVWEYLKGYDVSTGGDINLLSELAQFSNEELATLHKQITEPKPINGGE